MANDFDKSVRAKEEIQRRYGKCCALCERLDEFTVQSSFLGSKYRCSKGWCKLTEVRSCCKEKSADPKYGRDYAYIYKLITGSRFYYVLTAIYEVLGMSQTDNLFKELKALIEILREDLTLNNEASLYETYGPSLANSLVNDKNSVSLCVYLRNTYLKEALENIKNHKEEEAIKVYFDMILFLYNRYNLELTDIEEYEKTKSQTK